MMSRRPDIAQLAEHLTVDSSSHQMVPGSIPGVRRSFPSRMRHTHFVRAIAKTCCCGREEPAIAKLSTPGLEPGASRLLAERSNQLSYARDFTTALFCRRRECRLRRADCVPYVGACDRFMQWPPACPCVRNACRCVQNQYQLKVYKILTPL